MFLYNRFSFSFFFLFLSFDCSTLHQLFIRDFLLLDNCRSIRFQVDKQLVLFL